MRLKIILKNILPKRGNKPPLFYFYGIIKKINNSIKYKIMRRKIGMTLVMVFIIMTMCLPTKSHAINFQKKDTVVWSENSDENFYTVGSTIDISGTINGDVFAAGQTITISGNIKGDVFLAGGQIVIDGNVEGDVRALGTVIDLRGSVGKNVLATGNNMVISSDANVGRHVTFVGNILKIDGPMGGNLEAGVNNLTINNTIGGSVDVELSAGDDSSFKIMQNATIAKNLNYKATQKADISSGAKISGKTNYSINKAHKKTEGGVVRKWNRNIGRMVGIGGILKFVSLFLVGMLIILLLPKLVNDFDHIMRKDFWKNFSYGLLWFFISPVACLFLMITVVGIPLALIGIALYIIFLYLAKIFAAIVIGKIVIDYFKWNKVHKLVSFLIGLLLICVVGLIPFFGWMIVWVVCMWAFGSGVKMKVNMLKKWR